MEYAIVDLETTGGDSRRSRVIEIAVYAFDGNKIIDEYSSLVNPGVNVPEFITNLTGISNEMLMDAPSFDEIYEKVASITHDRIFVAHNVGFDYSFLRNEFKLLDQRFIRKRLCTVRTTRQIFPNLGSYSLGNICKKFDIPIENRHRAFGDARATTALLKHLLTNDLHDAIGESLKRYSREAMLPPNLPREDFDALPEEPGVYYFHNQKGKVIYVGKAKSLRDRVSGHFMDSNVAGKSRKFKSEIYKISFELTGNELIALLFESAEIKRLWPKYNDSQKRPPVYYSILKYEDRNGYARLTISKGKSADVGAILFNTYNEGWSFLRKFTRDNKLCPRLSGLQNTTGSCYAHQSGNCNGACVGDESPEVYNQRVHDAISNIREESETYAVIGNGRTTEENSIILVQEGKYIGYGYLQEDVAITSPESVLEIISPYIDNPDIQRILHWQLARYPKSKILNFSNERSR